MQFPCSSENTTTYASLEKLIQIVLCCHKHRQRYYYNNSCAEQVSVAQMRRQLLIQQEVQNLPSFTHTLFQLRMQIEDACMAIRNNHSSGALRDLDLAIKSIDDNMLANQSMKTTTTAPGAVAGRQQDLCIALRSTHLILSFYSVNLASLV